MSARRPIAQPSPEAMRLAGVERALLELRDHIAALTARLDAAAPASAQALPPGPPTAPPRRSKTYRERLAAASRLTESDSPASQTASNTPPKARH